PNLQVICLSWSKQPLGNLAIRMCANGNPKSQAQAELTENWNRRNNASQNISASPNNFLNWTNTAVRDKVPSPDRYFERRRVCQRFKSLPRLNSTWKNC